MDATLFSTRHQQVSPMQKKYSKMGAFALVVAIHLAAIYSLVEFGLSGQAPIKSEPMEISVQLISSPAPTPQVTPDVVAPPTPKPPQPKPKTVTQPQKVTPVKREPPKPVTPPTPNSITEKQAPPAAQEAPKDAQEADVTQKKEQVQQASSSNSAPAAQGVPKTIDSSDVDYINRPVAVYPSVSRRLGEQGIGKYRVLINASGKIDDITVQQSTGYDRLDNVAIQAIRRATFKPHMENGRPIAVYAIIPIEFKL